MSIKLKGTYTVQVVRDGKIIKEHVQENLLTTAGIRSLMSNLRNDYVRSLAVGTGTNPPQPTDTNLTNRITRNFGFQPNSRDVTPSGNTEFKLIEDFITATFDLGAVVGNITEVGVYNFAGLMSRSIFTDSEGNITPITVTAQDQLIVNYSLRHGPYPNSESFTVDVGGTSTTVTVVRSSNYSTSSPPYVKAAGIHGVILDDFSGSRVRYAGGPLALPTPLSPPPSTTSSSNFSRSINLRSTGTIADLTIEFGINGANFSGGLALIRWENVRGEDIMMHFDPPIPKTSNDRLTINLVSTYTDSSS